MVVNPGKSFKKVNPTAREITVNSISNISLPVIQTTIGKTPVKVNKTNRNFVKENASKAGLYQKTLPKIVKNIEEVSKPKNEVASEVFEFEEVDGRINYKPIKDKTFIMEPSPRECATFVTPKEVNRPSQTTITKRNNQTPRKKWTQIDVPLVPRIEKNSEAEKFSKFDERKNRCKTFVRNKSINKNIDQVESSDGRDQIKIEDFNSQKFSVENEEHYQIFDRDKRFEKPSRTKVEKERVSIVDQKRTQKLNYPEEQVRNNCPDVTIDEVQTQLSKIEINEKLGSPKKAQGTEYRFQEMKSTLSLNKRLSNSAFRFRKPGKACFTFGATKPDASKKMESSLEQSGEKFARYLEKELNDLGSMFVHTSDDERGSIEEDQSFKEEDPYGYDNLSKSQTKSKEIDWTKRFQSQSSRNPKSKSSYLNPRLSNSAFWSRKMENTSFIFGSIEPDTLQKVEHLEDFEWKEGDDSTMMDDSRYMKKKLPDFGETSEEVSDDQSFRSETYIENEFFENENSKEIDVPNVEDTIHSTEELLSQAGSKNLNDLIESDLDHVYEEDSINKKAPIESKNFDKILTPNDSWDSCYEDHMILKRCEPIIDVSDEIPLKKRRICSTLSSDVSKDSCKEDNEIIYTLGALQLQKEQCYGSDHSLRIEEYEQEEDFEEECASSINIQKLHSDELTKATQYEVSDEEQLEFEDSKLYLNEISEEEQTKVIINSYKEYKNLDQPEEPRMGLIKNVIKLPAMESIEILRSDTILSRKYVLPAIEKTSKSPSPAIVTTDPFVLAQQQMQQLILETSTPKLSTIRPKTAPCLKTELPLITPTKPNTEETPIRTKYTRTHLVPGIDSPKTHFPLLSKNLKNRSSVIDPPMTFQDHFDIDPDLINSTDNLSIPEELNLDFEESIDLKDFLFSPLKFPSKPKQLKNREDVEKYLDQMDGNKDVEEDPGEELFNVDDELYAEYKQFEKLYLQEKGLLSGQDPAGGDIQENKTEGHGKAHGDSAYSSLNRSTSKEYNTFHNQGDCKSPVTSSSESDTPIKHRKKTSAIHKSLLNSVANPQFDCNDNSSHESRRGSMDIQRQDNNRNLCGSSKLPKFCHECGSKYPVDVAKFCVNCGAKRLVLGF